jgi:hypothetical protein
MLPVFLSIKAIIHFQIPHYQEFVVRKQVEKAKYYYSQTHQASDDQQPATFDTKMDI